MPARNKPAAADDSASITGDTPFPPHDGQGPDVDPVTGDERETTVGPSPDDLVPAEPNIDPEPEAKVLARYVGIEPVLAHIDGEAVIIEPGDQIPVSAEQLEQNPVFQPWED